MSQTEFFDKVRSLREEREELKQSLLTKKAELLEALSKVEELLTNLESSAL